ncbi:MAG: CPBP family intramembrane metalloprotease, partial [Oscillochloris sp.]|nr:CPBP family intramembrane metalloprotease [Oscillochloris sp.]
MHDELLVPDPVPPSAPERLGWGWRDLGLTLLVFIGGGAVLMLLVRFVASLLGIQPGDGMLSPVTYVAGIGLYLALLLGIYLFAARRVGWAALGLRSTGWINFALVPLLFIVGMCGLISVNLLVMQLAGNFENPQVQAISGGKAMSLVDLGAGLLLIAV